MSNLTKYGWQVGLTIIGVSIATAFVASAIVLFEFGVRESVAEMISMLISIFGGYAIATLLDVWLWALMRAKRATKILD